MKIHVKRFDQLTVPQLYGLLRLRSEIFVVEQDCVYQDMDARDQHAIHLFGIENEQLIACARCFAPGDYFEQASIGRIAVSSRHRGKNYGHQIVDAAIQMLLSEHGNIPIKISAQTYLEGFYRSHGFDSTGTPYLEDGIPHVAMIRMG